MTAPRRFCAADIGSNAIKTRIVEADGVRRTLSETRYPIRLGQSVFSGGEIDPAAIEATASAFEEIAALCRSYSVDVVRAVATSATREASNGQQLIDEIKRRSGIQVGVIRGGEEARLVAVGVRPEMNPDTPNLIIDVGGGSTECIYSRNPDKIAFARSMRLGAVRLQQMFKAAPPMSKKQFATLEAAVAEILDQAQLPVVAKSTHTIGLAGTMRALLEARHCGKPYTSTSISIGELEDLLHELCGQTLDAMESTYQIDRKRGQIIIHGGAIVLGIMRLYNLDTITVSNRGLRDGLIEELIQGAGRETSHTTESAAIIIGEKYAFDQKHGQHVAKLAVSLFDQTPELHELDLNWREVLYIASLLHDVGQYISYSKHHKHSWYLILNETLPGLTPEQQHAAAAIARYHRKAAPLERHPEYSYLSEEVKSGVGKCAALLRVADALDRQHRGLVHTVSVEISPEIVTISAFTTAPVLLELSATARKSPLFETLFTKKLKVVVTGSSDGDIGEDADDDGGSGRAGK